MSFGASPFLLQHMTGHYSNISISTAGNQIREAKGMKADINIDDVRLEDNGNSEGHHRGAQRDDHLDGRGHQGDHPELDSRWSAASSPA